MIKEKIKKSFLDIFELLVRIFLSKKYMVEKLTNALLVKVVAFFSNAHVLY